jgi:hypothetical protein
MDLDKVQIRRLAFIKYLYRLGLESLGRPDPQASASLLAFHDAAELFLGQAAEFVNAPLQPTATFDAYWKALDTALSPKKVARKDAMLRLNRARVALKHHGTFPDRLSLETFARTAEDFFQENTRTVFGVSWAEVSMAILVFPDEAREKVLEAQQLKANGDRNAASAGAAIALEMIVRDYEQRKRDRFGRSPFFLGERLPTIGAHSLIDSSLGAFAGSNRGREAGRRLDIGKVTRFAESITSTVRDLQSALKIIALGLDFRKYSRFAFLTPRPQLMQDGTWIVHETRSFSEHTLTEEECQFCVEFVIEASLIMQEFDYTRPPRIRPLEEVAQ